MKLRTIAAGLLAAAVVPAAALAEPPTAADRANGARACQTVKEQLGDATFKATYGANAFGKCVAAWAQQAAAARKAAQTACRAEAQDAAFAASHGGKTFVEFYGGKSAGNAVARCVAAKQGAQTAAAVKTTVSAAKACALMKRLTPTTFAQTYGTKPAAFGACVAKLAKSQQNP